MVYSLFLYNGVIIISMSDIEEYFSKIEKTDKKDIKKEFVNFCKFNISLEEKGELNIPQASKNICSACNKFFDDLMPEFDEVMDIACDLEIPTEYRDRPLEDWDILIKIFKKF